MICRQQASEAAKRAQVVEEYLLRKREAAAYRARGQQWLMVRMSIFLTSKFCFVSYLNSKIFIYMLIHRVLLLTYQGQKVSFEILNISHFHTHYQ